MIPILTRCEDNEGTIGKRSKSDLQRLPSSVYWGALHRGQICLFKGSRDQYHRAFDRLRRRRNAALVPDDEGIESELQPVWHPRIPAPPDGWPDDVNFQLTRQEAEFITGRIAATCPGSMLAWLALHAEACEVDSVWEHPQLGEAPEALRNRIDLARRFSLVMHGAALLYNLMLAQRYPQEDKRDEWIPRFRKRLEAWATGAEREDLQSFRLPELWRCIDGEGARVPMQTRHFVERWVSMLHESDPAAVPDNEHARQMVEDRERALKKARSRFANRRALDTWGGSSGAGRLNYRWSVVQSHLRDLRGAKG